MISPAEFDAIKKRAEAATPGSWTSEPRDGRGGFSVFGAREADGARVVVSDWCCPDDAFFLVAAREDVPALVAEVKRLRAALEAIGDRGHDYTATGYVSSRHDEDCGRCVARRALGLDGQPPHETGPSCPPHCDGGAA